MKHYRRTTSCWLISQTLCFCLLLQGSGIAQALPLSPKKTFVSKSELEATRPEGAVPGHPVGGGFLARFVDKARTTAGDTGVALERWLEGHGPESNAGTEAPLRVAQANGALPLPVRLMAAVPASSGQGQAAPPKPPGLGDDPVEATPPEELAGLLEKAGTDQIPLVAGLNLISIPEEPADPEPAAVFAAVAGQVGKVKAFDACDPSDPWKVYDPNDPAASDLTAVDPRIGMWVKATSAATLTSEGTLPAATTIELCEGWNLIGFPAGEPRHPYAALASIAGKWQRIFAYDAFDPEDPWESWANDLELMVPGRGYWVLASEAVTLEIRNQGPPPM